MKKYNINTICILFAYIFVVISLYFSYGKIIECRIDFIVDTKSTKIKLNDYKYYIKKELDNKFINVVKSSKSRVLVNTLEKTEFTHLLIYYQLYPKNVELSFIVSSLSTFPKDFVGNFPVKLFSQNQVKCVEALKRIELIISFALVTLLFLMIFFRKK
jgi:hypothetical protein